MLCKLGKLLDSRTSFVFNTIIFPPFPSGLQVILPEYLQEHFVQAALSYIACNSEGEFICKDNDCWCQCGPKFPECNCPYMDIQAMEENLLRISETWNAYNSEFEESGEILYFNEYFPLLWLCLVEWFGFQLAHPCCLYDSLVPYLFFLNAPRFVSCSKVCFVLQGLFHAPRSVSCIISPVMITRNSRSTENGSYR